MRNLIPHFIAEQYKQANYSGSFEAVTMFVDISGFTQTTEVLIRGGQSEGAEILSQIMRFYFTPTVQSVYQHGGWITNFAGDAFTALFPLKGDPKGLRKPLGSVPAHALTAAAEIQRFFAANPVYRSKYGDFDFAVKVGLDVGEVDWGIVGTERRKTYYFRGPAIDGCSHAEHCCQKGEVWTTPTVTQSAPTLIAQSYEKDGFIRLDQFNPDGFSKPIRFGSQTISRQALLAFGGSALADLPASEFRLIVPVFVAFEQVENLNDFVGYALTQLETYGGTLSRLDFGDKGGNLLFFFGAPIAYEDNQRRALQFISALKNYPSALKLRAGLTVGDSYCGLNGSDLRAEFTCLGNAVNQSARFMTKAAWGQILVDQSLAQNKYFNCEHLGDFAYKGRAQAIPTYELIGELHEIADFFQGRMIGRQAELARLIAFAQPIFSPFEGGQGDDKASSAPDKSSPSIPLQRGTRFAGVVSVYGEAGQGKSRLMFELERYFKDTTAHTDALWLEGQCDQILRKPFNPFCYILNQRFGLNRAETLADKKTNFEIEYDQLIARVESLIPPSSDAPENSPLTKGAGGLYDDAKSAGLDQSSLPSEKQPPKSPFFKGDFAEDEIRKIAKELIRTRSILGALLGLSWENSLYEQLDAKGRYENTLYALKNWLQAESLLRPVALLLEDGHWLDDDSHSALQTLCRGIDAYPMVILATLRYADDGGKPLFIKKLEPKIKTLTIDLNHLSAEETLVCAEGELAETEAVAPLGADAFQLIWDRTHGNPFFARQVARYLLENNLIRLQDGEWHLAQTGLVLPDTVQAILLARLDRLTIAVKETVKAAAVIGREFEVKLLAAVLRQDPLPEVRAATERQVWSAVNELQYLFRHALLRDVAYDMQMRARLRELHRLTAEAIEILYADALAPKYGDVAFHYDKAHIVDKALAYYDKAGDYAKENFQNNVALNFYDRLIALLSEELIVKSEKFSKKEKPTTLEEAIQVLKSAPQLLTINFSLLTNYLDTFYKQADILHLTGKWDRAGAILQNAIAAATATRRRQQEAKLKVLLGWILKVKGDYDTARSISESAQEIALAIQDHKTGADALNTIGNIYWHQGAYEQALAYQQKSLAIREEIGDKGGMASSLNSIGEIYRNQGADEQALAWYQKSLAIYEEIGDKRGISISLNNIGIIYMNKGASEQALTNHQKSLVIKEEIGDKWGIAASLSNIGSIYSNQGAYEQALACQQKSLAIVEEIGNKAGIAILLNNIGNIYLNQGAYDQTLACQQKSLAIVEEIGNKGTIGYHYASLAHTYIHLREFAKALEMALLHFKNMQEIGSDVEHGNTHLAIALVLAHDQTLRVLKTLRVYLDEITALTGLPETPVAYFEKAIETAAAKNYIETLVPALSEYGRYLDQAGQPQAGLSQLRQAKEKAVAAGMQGEVKKIEKIFDELGITNDEQESAPQNEEGANP